MKVIILAGGFGTRIGEETALKPKPMIEIGGKPILWHIMKIYLHYGFNDFIICLGYKGYAIKEYFDNLLLHDSDVMYSFGETNSKKFLSKRTDSFNVTLIDTGLNTMTGGRIKRIERYIDNEPFMVTYGDGLANINIKKLVEYHKSHDRIVTVSAAQPLGRFGAMQISSGGIVEEFREKPLGDGNWINAGFFVMTPRVFDYIDGDDSVFEKSPLERLTADNQLVAFKHPDFFQPLDTLRDKKMLEDLWASDNAPWMIWK
ncbi:MAG: glucose-1-phosphate cytidylyltransferase [Methanospirillum sp.]|uniref:glucose-1-phosphate cytidylyltransferase n=1 Tax=Methanospirillum sp. TaxID=45200 RepID=UPI002372257B|nr:glucose-1-phosphate cytidylyltransferase [Methanospirillum sp.]MDD1729893.1 glucose-1-phosphate cytidylyltransferase [Methanospirillum sp.]